MTLMPRFGEPGDEAIEVALRAELRIDGRVVADVVAEVEARGRIDRRKPDRVHPERVGAPGKMVKVACDPFEVPKPVAARVGKRTRVDLVDHPGLPRRPTAGCLRLLALHQGTGTATSQRTPYGGRAIKS